jgi:hypothetical protein
MCLVRSYLSWSGHIFPEKQIASLDEAHGRIRHASPEAWRWIGWRWTDPATGQLRILPAEYFGPLPSRAQNPLLTDDPPTRQPSQQFEPRISINMRANSIFQRVMASSLAVLLVSCSASRHSAAGPARPHELARYVLIIKETPAGGVEHEWRPLKDFPVEHRSVSHGSTFYGQARTVALTGAECRQQYEVCVPTCKASTRIFQVGNYSYDSTQWGPWRKGKWRYCEKACMKQFAECESKADPEPRRFEAIEPAVDWVKENRNELLVGAVIVIAGVAFVAVLVGTGGGSLALVPLVMVASPGQPSGAGLMAVHP